MQLNLCVSLSSMVDNGIGKLAEHPCVGVVGATEQLAKGVAFSIYLSKIFAKTSDLCMKRLFFGNKPLVLLLIDKAHLIAVFAQAQIGIVLP